MLPDWVMMAVTVVDAAGSVNSRLFKLLVRFSSADFVLSLTNFFTACFALTGAVATAELTVAVDCTVVKCGACVTTMADVCLIFRGDVAAKPLNCTGMFPGLIGWILLAICPIIVVTGSCDALWFPTGNTGAVLCSQGRIGR